MAESGESFDGHQQREKFRGSTASAPHLPRRGVTFDVQASPWRLSFADRPTRQKSREDRLGLLLQEIVLIEPMRMQAPLPDRPTERNRICGLMVC